MVGRPMKWDQRIGRRLKLHDLHVLLTVAELGSMGKAAGHLAVSQPSVSKAIADIEHAVGVRLLDRTAKGVELTDYGRALLRRGMGAFDELRQGIREIETLADPSTGEVRVGCPEAIATGLMLNVIDKFSRRHPRVVVSVIAANSLSHEFRLLRDRVVDFLIGALPQPFADDDLDHEFLYRDQPFFLCGSKHPLARRRRVMLADLVDEPWLLPERVRLLPYAGFRSERPAAPAIRCALLLGRATRQPARHQPFHLRRVGYRAPLQSRTAPDQGAAGRAIVPAMANRARHLEEPNRQPRGPDLPEMHPRNR